LQFLSCDISDTLELTEDSTTETNSTSRDSELEVHITTGHNSDSESDLWDGFDFPQLTAEEDAQLTIALQGDTSGPTTSIETSTAMIPQEVMVDYSYIRSRVQGPTEGASESGPSSTSPPPYMTELGESNNSEPGNLFFINNNSVVPMSSTNGQFYIVEDRVYHVIRQM
jgi:hypothetical protein